MAIAEISAIAFGQGSFAVSQAGEDGAFYVQIAHNMASGYGITFDRIAPTTGIHWGWLLLLAGIFRAIPTDDPELLFRISGIAYFLLLLGAGSLVALRSPVAGVFLVGYLANRGHWDMETHLVLLTLAMFYSWPTAIIGFLLVFARTDMIIFAGIFAFLTWRWSVMAGAGFGFIAVCVLNYWVDGNAVSVSAGIKSAGFNDIATVYRTVAHLAVYYFPVLEIMGALSLVYLWRDRCDGVLKAGLIASIALLIIHIVHNSMTEGWYLAPLFLSSLLCSSALLQQVMGPTVIIGLMRASSPTSSVR